MSKREWLAFPVYMLAELCGLFGEWSENFLLRLARKIAGPYSDSVDSTPSTKGRT